MPLTLHAVSVPVFVRALKALDALLTKGEESAVARGFDPAVLLTSRLAPDMFRSMYPGVDRFLEVKQRVDPDGVLRSDLGRRLGLCADTGTRPGATPAVAPTPAKAPARKRAAPRKAPAAKAPAVKAPAVKKTAAPPTSSERNEP